MESYAGYKKTNLMTYELGKYRRIYKKDDRLFYRAGNTWHGTFIEYCEELNEYRFKKY